MNATRFCLLLPTAFLIVSLPSQALTIVDGNMNVVTGALATTQSPASLVLSADAIGQNHAFEHWWYYRVAGDTRENSLRNIGTIVSGVTASLNHLDRDFSDLDQRGLLSASLDMDTYDAGPASGVVISRLTLTNISAAPVTIDIFCYTDLDIAGTSGDDVVTGNGSRHFVTDPSGVQIEVRALGNDRSAVAAYPALRNLLTNALLDDLPNSLPPFSGDYTGAFQWQNRTLQPFEDRTFHVVLAVDTAAAALPLVQNYGAGNGSTLKIHTSTVPLQDNSQPRQFMVQMKGALPMVPYRILSSFAPVTAFPFIPGLILWADPFLAIGVFGGFTNAFGEAGEVFTVPPSPYLAGFPTYHQCFAVDGAAPNGFAYYTPGMMVRIGKL
ncbi:MAG: hypothetical protein ABIP94_15420 [Planctomycetota bacterium]